MICIAGKNNIAINVVKYLFGIGIEKDNIIACINKTDDGINSWQQSFKRFCLDKEIRMLDLDSLYTIENLFFFSVEFDRIIKPSLFVSDKLFNIHFSKLPSYKGMYTSVIPILDGKNSAGVTLHKIDQGIDTGEIINQIEFELSYKINSLQLYNLFVNYGTKLFIENFSSILKGNYNSKKQEVINSSYFSKNFLNFKELKLNVNKTAFEIHNQVRAFSFRPYQLPKFNGFSISHSVIEDVISSGKPGTVIIEDEESFLLNSIDYNIRLFKDKLPELLEAAKFGDLAFIKRLYKMHYSLIEKNDKGWDLLIVSVFNNQLEISKWLINNNFNINSCNYNGTTVLMYAMTSASYSNSFELLKYILSCKPYLYQEDYKNRNVFSYAEEYGNKKVIDLLNECIGKSEEKIR